MTDTEKGRPVFATRSIAVFTEWFIPTSSRRSRTSGAPPAWARARRGRESVARQSVNVSVRRIGMVGTAGQRTSRT